MTQHVHMIPSTPAAALAPADFSDVSYHPSLLLPVTWASSLVAPAEYANACRDGFISYFEEMMERDEDHDEVVYISRYYTRREVFHQIAENVTQQELPLSWRAGFMLGWLSALALTDRTLAIEGLQVLTSLLEHLSTTAPAA